MLAPPVGSSPCWAAPQPTLRGHGACRASVQALLSLLQLLRRAARSSAEPQRSPLAASRQRARQSAQRHTPFARCARCIASRGLFCWSGSCSERVLWGACLCARATSVFLCHGCQGGLLSWELDVSAGLRRAWALVEACPTSPAARAQVEQPEGEVIDLSAIPSPRVSGAAALLPSSLITARPFTRTIGVPAMRKYGACLLTFQPAGCPTMSLPRAPVHALPNRAACCCICCRSLVPVW